ncbi:hypothetical protein FCK90_08595 [Kocuria coralli]|uniref:Uncharacterized protein n=1 Tax=Kocuria coralli TaxID=1461025 RepID=A0A5J5KZ34_9MICC|nr:hypothetical protein [Kocuria coralli]KAA9394165.1 hypothetical protein FCK90_08595 [Kocuria coralli]
MATVMTGQNIGDWLSEGSRDGFQATVERFAEDSWTFLRDAFEASNLSPEWWAGVVGAGDDPGMLWVIIVVMAPILVALVAAQVVTGVFQSRSDKILRGAAAGFFGIPVTMILVTLIMSAAAAFDGVTNFILEVNGETQNMSGFMQLFGFELNDQGEFQQANSEYNIWRGVGDNAGGFELIVPAVLAGVIWLASMFLSFMLSLRTMLLVLLTAFAAVAVFGLSLDATKAWFFRWLAIIFGLLIAKPLAAGTLVMGISVFRYAATTQQFVAALVCVVIAAVMPLATMGIFGFTAVAAAGGAERSMAGATGAGGRVGGRVMQSVTRLIRR